MEINDRGGEVGASIAKEGIKNAEFTNQNHKYSEEYYHERRNAKIDKIRLDRLKIVLRTILGSVVEYCDFGLYAFFAPMIGRLFFPLQDAFAQILFSLAVFAIGFLMRPIGAVAFGYIGDKIGRKTALRIAIVGMTFSTLAIAVLPTYAQIGLAAPIILVLIRLIQGLCIGGEGAGSAVFILENISGRKFGFVGSIVMIANILGTLLANLIVIVIANTIGINEFTWRIGFIVGFLMGIVALYLRYKNDESPAFKRYHREMVVSKEITSPIQTVFKHHAFALFNVFILASAATSTAYFLRGYLFTYLVEMLGLSEFYAQYITFFSLLIVVLTLPLFGIIAEKIGYRIYLPVVSIIICISIWHIFKSLGMAYEINSYFSPVLYIAILCAAISAPAYPYAINSFPTNARYTGVALGWNLGNALFGGTTPFMCGYLSKYWGIEAPAVYIGCVNAAFVVLYILSICFHNSKNDAIR